MGFQEKQKGDLPQEQGEILPAPDILECCDDREGDGDSREERLRATARQLLALISYLKRGR